MKNKFVVIFLCLLITIFTGCRKIQKTEIDIRVGASRDDVIKMLGEEDEQLSEDTVDVFYVDGEKITVYYETNDSDILVVDKVDITDSSADS